MTPEEQAHTLVQAICSTYAHLQQQQNDLFLDMGYTREERFDLSVRLAESLYTTGLVGYPKRKLHALMTEGELQTVLYLLVCGDTHERIEEQTTRRLLQRPDFHHATKQRRGPRTEATPEASDRVPSLSQRDRQARRGGLFTRTRRPRGRTGRSDDRAVY